MTMPKTMPVQNLLRYISFKAKQLRNVLGRVLGQKTRYKISPSVRRLFTEMVMSIDAKKPNGLRLENLESNVL